MTTTATVTATATATTYPEGSPADEWGLALGSWVIALGTRREDCDVGRVLAICEDGESMLVAWDAAGTDRGGPWDTITPGGIDVFGPGPAGRQEATTALRSHLASLPR